MNETGLKKSKINHIGDLTSQVNTSTNLEQNICATSNKTESNNTVKENEMLLYASVSNNCDQIEYGAKSKFKSIIIKTQKILGLCFFAFFLY